MERHCDGARGWVPSSSARELESNHVRARNFKQRHAFLKLLSSGAGANTPDGGTSEAADESSSYA